MRYGNDLPSSMAAMTFKHNTRPPAWSYLPEDVGWASDGCVSDGRDARVLGPPDQAVPMGTAHGDFHPDGSAQACIFFRGKLTQYLDYIVIYF